MGSGNEWGSGNKLGAQRAEQFPHLGNYTLTPATTDKLYLSEVCFEFLLGVACLVDSSGEYNVCLLLLSSHVITGRLQHAVHNHT